MPVNAFSHYPQGFPHGVVLRGLSVLNGHYGNIWWVDSGVGNDSGGADGSITRPFATIDYAVGRCTADNNDIIIVAPGHSETVSAAGGIDLDVSGISIIGLGNGRERPTINFTATGSDIDIDAANVYIENVYFDVTGVDAVTGAIDVNSADFSMVGCEALMADSGGQATRFIVGATAADRMRIIGNVIRSPNAGAASAINLVGTADGTEIGNNHIYGDFSVAGIENATGNVLTNLNIHDNYVQNDNAGNFALELVSACTGTVRSNHFVTDAIATAVDWGACSAFDNLYFDSSDTDSAATTIPTAQTTGGMDLVTIGDRLGTEADTDPVSAVLSGSAGITTWKSSAAPGTGVSMSEVLRSIYDAVAADSAATTTVHSQLGRRVTKVGTLASDPDDLFTVTGKCLVTLMVGECTSVVAVTTSLSLNTSTNSIVIAASTDIVGDAAGALYIVTGDPDDGLNGQASGADTNVDVARARSGQIAPFMINDDNIYMNLDGAGTGLIQWDLYYIPLEASASIASSA